jgi:hypothetical protein
MIRAIRFWFWLLRVRRVLVKVYGWLPADARVSTNRHNRVHAWLEYFEDGASPEEAAYEDASYGD